MFDTITRGFRQARNRLAGLTELTEKNIDSALREVRLSLLEADVELGVAKTFLARVKERALGQTLQTKVKHIETFLKEHNKVRVTVVFRGRENQHRNLGEEILISIRDNLAGIGVPEGKPQMMGNRMSIMLAPVAAKQNVAPKPAGGQPAPKPAPKPAPGT